MKLGLWVECNTQWRFPAPLTRSCWDAVPMLDIVCWSASTSLLCRQFVKYGVLWRLNSCRPIIDGIGYFRICIGRCSNFIIAIRIWRRWGAPGVPVNVGLEGWLSHSVRSANRFGLTAFPWLTPTIRHLRHQLRPNQSGIVFPSWYKPIKFTGDNITSG